MFKGLAYISCVLILSAGLTMARLWRTSLGPPLALAHVALKLSSQTDLRH